MILQVNRTMEETTRKFICKFCNRSFPCGKSLGGHIRTHMNQHSSNNNKATAKSGKFESNGVDAATRKKRKKRDLSSSDYGLRENPRKTKRFVHHHPLFTLHHNKEKFCRECGKGFSSLKALCGHMARHSEKDQKQNFAMIDYDDDAQSDTETSDPEDLKRTRFMTVNNNPTSSSLSEVEREEAVEEVAMCLILLSKDFYNHNKGRFGFDKDSNSDNYSAVLEAKSNSVDGQNKVNNKNSVYNASELVKLGKDKMKLKFSDSWYSRYGSKNEDSSVSVHGVLRNGVFNQPKVEEDGHGFKDYDVFEPRKLMMNNNRCYRSKNSTESKKLVVSGNSDKFDSFNSAKQEYLGHNLDEVSCCKKKKKTSFPNHDSEESYASAEKITDSSTDSDSFPYSYEKPKSSNKAKMKKVMMKKSKKTKEHECPICHRTFRSGQALGGHKRSHFVGGFEENNYNNNTEIVKQESQSPSSSSPSSPAVFVPCLVDLNLPAPVDE